MYIYIRIYDPTCYICFSPLPEVYRHVHNARLQTLLLVHFQLLQPWFFSAVRKYYLEVISNLSLVCILFVTMLVFNNIEYDNSVQYINHQLLRCIIRLIII